MKFLLETVLSVSGLVIFLALAFFAPSFFWIGLAILLILGAIAFILGYFGRTKNAEETLEEVMTTLEGDEKEKQFLTIAIWLCFPKFPFRKGLFRF